ncbi:MAG: hypothetical protein WBD20_01250 [Pirellulaceae bacterium]
MSRAIRQATERDKAHSSENDDFVRHTIPLPPYRDAASEVIFRFVNAVRERPRMVSFEPTCVFLKHFRQRNRSADLGRKAKITARTTNMTALLGYLVAFGIQHAFRY